MNQGIAYRVRISPRSRRLTLRVSDRGVIVTAPRFVASHHIVRFVSEHADWIKRALRRMEERNLLVPQASRARNYLQHKEEAQRFVEARLAHFNSTYGFVWRRVSIRNQTTRWGSCSRSGNLTFNFQIVLLPPHLADLVIVHELCHLKELNHSARFWALVRQTIPDMAERRRELRSFRLR